MMMTQQNDTIKCVNYHINCDKIYLVFFEIKVYCHVNCLGVTVFNYVYLSRFEFMANSRVYIGFVFEEPLTIFNGFQSIKCIAKTNKNKLISKINEH